VPDDRRKDFENLCRAEYAAVVRAAYLITGDPEEAADVAQEAFARAYERWSSVSRLDQPGAWVQRVAINLAISWWRRQRVRARFPDAGEIGARTDSDLEDTDLMAALQALAPAQRAAVVLRYFADQSVEHAAQALGKRPGTIRALTSQGLARLRVLLSKEAIQDEP